MPSIEDQIAAEMLARDEGGIGAVAVQAHYPGVGQVAVTPQYPGVGAPANFVPQQQQGAPGAAPVNYSGAAYSAGDVSYLGLGVTSVPAGTVNQRIQVLPNRPFTPQWYISPSNVQNLLITQISVGGVGLLANELGMPIECFSEVSNMPQIMWPTLDPAVGIVYIVSNPTAQDRDFSGTLYGTSVRI